MSRDVSWCLLVTHCQLVGYKREHSAPWLELMLFTTLAASETAPRAKLRKVKAEIPFDEGHFRLRFFSFFSGGLS